MSDKRYRSSDDSRPSKHSRIEGSSGYQGGYNERSDERFSRGRGGRGRGRGPSFQSGRGRFTPRGRDDRYNSTNRSHDRGESRGDSRGDRFERSSRDRYDDRDRYDNRIDHSEREAGEEGEEESDRRHSSSSSSHSKSSFDHHSERSHNRPSSSHQSYSSSSRGRDDYRSNDRSNDRSERERDSSYHRQSSSSHSKASYDHHSHSSSSRGKSSSHLKIDVATPRGQSSETPQETPISSSHPTPITTKSVVATPSAPTYSRYPDLVMLVKTTNSILNSVQCKALCKLGIQNEFKTKH